MKNNNLLASSGSIKNLEKLLNQYFFSTSYKIDENLNISNKNGPYDKIIVVKKNNRYYLYINVFKYKML